MSKDFNHFYEFGPYRLDPSERLLMRDGVVTPLTPKAFEMLLVLVEHSGRVLEKEELMKRLWPDSFVEEANLSNNVFMLRKALGEGIDGRKYIETVPRRGYRFVASVREVCDEHVNISVREETFARLVIEEQSEAASTNDSLEVVPVNHDTALPPARSNEASTRRWPSRVAVVIACALVVGLALAAYLWTKRAGQQMAGGPRIKSIAVLPFKPLSAESRDEALEVGMADALTTRLSGIKQIIVRPTSSVRKYTNLQQDPLAAGRELGVESVLEGHIQRLGDRLRVTLRLVRVSDGASLWAEQFYEKFTDIFAVQDSISQKVVSALALSLTGEEQKRLTRHHTDNPDAYQLYLQGRFLWTRFTREARESSINYFNAALEKDPNYALAYAGLADAYATIAIYGPVPPKEIYPKWREAALKAVELDDNLGEAHTAVGALKVFHEWDWPEAEKSLRRGMELSPSYPDAYILYGYYLQATRRADESISFFRRARELSPFWNAPANDALYAPFLARRYDEAIAESRDMLKLEPTRLFPYYVLGQAYVQKGIHDEAIAAFQQAIEISKGASKWAMGELAYAYAASGRRDEALKIISRLKEEEKLWEGLSFYLSLIYTGLGDYDQAFAWLDKALEERFTFLWRINCLPQYDPLRSDPRFSNLLRRMNLAP